MKNYFFLFLLFFAISTASAQFIESEWVRQFKGQINEDTLSYSEGNLIAIDGDGNIIIAGTFKGTVDFDPTAGVAEQETAVRGQMYISKLNPDGNLIWVKTVTSKISALGRSLVVDDYGNIYITGQFTDSVRFSPGNNSFDFFADAYNAFVLKMSPSGEIIWVKQMKSFHNCIGETLVIDKWNNLYVGGTFKGETEFEVGNPLYVRQPRRDKDIFITKMNLAGDVLWVKQFKSYSRSPTGNKTVKLAVDQSGNLFSAGIFKDSTDFDPGSSKYILKSESYEPDVFICKLNELGQFIWARKIGGLGYKHAESISIYGNGDLLITGIFNGTVDFDPGSGSFHMDASDTANNKLFLLKLDSAGQFQWAKQTAGWKGFSHITDRNAQLDFSGNIYIAGMFRGKSDFDPDKDSFLLQQQNESVYISKLTAEGKHSWTKYFKPSGEFSYSKLSSIVLDKKGNIHSTGLFVDSVYFNADADSHFIVAAHYDTYIHKFNQCNSRSLEEITACTRYKWNGRSYTSSGIYFDTIPNSKGCDSLMQLHLSIIELDLTIEDHITFLRAAMDSASYQWMDCENGKNYIPGETSRSFQPLLNGNYAVVITKNNCTDTSDCVRFSAYSEKMRIVPNPTVGFFEILFNEEMNKATITIKDSRERLVHVRENFTGRRIQMKLPSESSGMYFIYVKENGETFQEKVVKYKVQ